MCNEEISQQSITRKMGLSEFYYYVNNATDICIDYIIYMYVHHIYVNNATDIIMYRLHHIHVCVPCIYHVGSFLSSALQGIVMSNRYIH